MSAENAAPTPLEEQVAELRARVRVLEGLLGLLPPSQVEAAEARLPYITPESPVLLADAPAPPPFPVTMPAYVPPGAAARAPGQGNRLGQPPVFAAASAVPEPQRSLESRIGSHLFNRIGVIALLIAAAWFLKLAIDNHWIGPLGRVCIGLLAGAGTVVWSERFRNRGFLAFSYSLKAVGSGVLYLSLWAAYSVYSLLPVGVAFGAMVLVTATNGYLAWAQDAELLALYAIVGGLGTPALLGTGGDHEVFLFNYLLLLDGAVLLLLMRKPWGRLLQAAFAGTVIFWGGWTKREPLDSRRAER